MAELDPQGHLLYALANTPLRQWPFPHFYAENCFPYEFYARLQSLLRIKEGYKELAGKYKNRVYTDDLAELGLDFMKEPDFMLHVLQLFGPWVKKRFPNPAEAHLSTDLRLIRDSSGYVIGPHTDAPKKVVSLLFYLPPDTFYQDHGTSIYAPKGGKFRCVGGPHYDGANFNRLYTAPYVPNACFGFFKTDNSFHGVEPIEAKAIRRDVLLFNIYGNALESPPC